jgi:hypothetical protein
MFLISDVFPTASRDAAAADKPLRKSAPSMILIKSFTNDQKPKFFAWAMLFANEHILLASFGQKHRGRDMCKDINHGATYGRIGKYLVNASLELALTSQPCLSRNIYVAI